MVPMEAGSRVASRRWVLRGGIVAAVFVVALVAWLATRGGGSGSSSEATPAEAGPRIVAPSELGKVAVASDHPVYWAGPMPGTRLELSEGPGGDTVRYLSAGVAPGSGRAKFLAVASYPLPNPRQAIERFAARPGSMVFHAAGRKIVVGKRAPESAYFADPENEVQVEVYDPSPGRALELAGSAKVRPAG